VERGNLLQRLVRLKGPAAEGDGDVRLLYAVDHYSVFRQHIHLAGWAMVPGARIESIALRFPSGATFTLASYGQVSPDVAAVHGAEAVQVRFDETIHADEPQQDVPAATLVVSIAGHGSRTIRDFGMPGPEDHGVQIQDDFAAHLKSRPAGRLLEIGSRARSGVTRRDLVPPGWS
jgi:hypothetical protein